MSQPNEEFVNHKKALEFYIRMLYHKLCSYSDKKMEEYGLTAQQSRLLFVIEYYLNNGYEITRRLLEEALEVKGPTITRMLDALVKKKLITKTQSADDGRAIDIKITNSGKELSHCISSTINDSERKLISNMTESEIASFRYLLEIALNNMRDD